MDESAPRATLDAGTTSPCAPFDSPLLGAASCTATGPVYSDPLNQYEMASKMGLVVGEGASPVTIGPQPFRSHRTHATTIVSRGSNVCSGAPYTDPTRMGKKKKSLYPLSRRVQDNLIDLEERMSNARSPSP